MNALKYNKCPEDLYRDVKVALVEKQPLELLVQRTLAKFTAKILSLMQDFLLVWVFPDLLYTMYLQ